MIKIDIDTRCWQIPKEECFLGVESDDKVKILQFELSKNEFCNGLNFTNCNCFINYKNEGNDTIPYLITDMEVQEDGTVTFTWEVSRGATIFKGNTFAILCAKKVREDGTITNEWNSRIGSFTVAKGIEPLSSITEVPEIDIISQLLSVAQKTNAKAETNINQSSQLLEKAEGLGYLKEEYDVLEARMNQFTSLKEGATTGDAELIDGRIGYDGKVYENIGGAIRGQVSELKGDLADITVRKKSSNLFNPDGMTDGFTINSSGNLVTNAGYSTTAFLECDGGKDLYCTTSSNETYPRTKASFAGILFYDLNKNVIADSYASFKAVATSPSNAKYFRIAIQNIHITDSFYAINYASTQETVPPYEPYYSYAVVKADTELSATSEEPIQNRAVYAKFQKEEYKNTEIDGKIAEINGVLNDNFVMVKPNNIFNKETVTADSNLKSDGTLKTESGYSVSDFIEVESGKTLYCNFKDGSNGMFNAYIVDAVFYGADKQTVISANISYWKYTITVPQDAVYLRLSVQSAKANTLCLFYDGYSTDYEAYFVPYRQSKDHDTVVENKEYIDQFAKNFRNTDYTKIEKSCHHVKSTRGPLVTIIADDGFAKDYTALKDMVDTVHETYPEANIPCCIAIHHFCFDRPTGMTLEQALYSQNKLGWEYCSHVDGTALATLETEKEIRECILTAQKAYAKNGLRVNNIVYPQGSNDERVRRIAKEYYNCGATTQTGYTGADPRGVNTGIIGSFYLKRWALGALYSGHGEGAGTFEGDYKLAVDRAIANNGWLIFMLHPAMSDHDETQQGYFVDTVKYIIKNNIPIVTLQQGLDIFGNAMECGDFLGSTSAHPEQGFAISKNGEFSKNPFI